MSARVGSSLAATATMMTGGDDPCRACIKQQLQSHRAAHSPRSSASSSSAVAPYSPVLDDDDEEEHVPSCTYTTGMPLDPTASCTLQNRMPSSMGILSVSFSGCGAFYPYVSPHSCTLVELRAAVATRSQSFAESDRFCIILICFPCVLLRVVASRCTVSHVTCRITMT
jgi:hypothetical protein